MTDSKQIDWTQPHQVVMNGVPGERMIISIDGEVHYDTSDVSYVPDGRDMFLTLQRGKEKWPIG